MELLFGHVEFAFPADIALNRTPRPVRSWVSRFSGFSSWGLRLEINEVKATYASSLISSDLFRLAYITTCLKSLYEKVGG